MILDPTNLRNEVNSLLSLVSHWRTRPILEAVENHVAAMLRNQELAPFWRGLTTVSRRLHHMRNAKECNETDYIGLNVKIKHTFQQLFEQQKEIDPAILLAAQTSFKDCVKKQALDDVETLLRSPIAPYLLDRPLDLTRESATTSATYRRVLPLQFTAYQDNLALAHLLVRAGADVNVFIPFDPDSAYPTEGTPLLYAPLFSLAKHVLSEQYKRMKGLMQLLLDEGADPNALCYLEAENPHDPLLILVARADEQLIQNIIDAGICLDHITKSYRELITTPLQAACYQGRASVVERLIYNGAPTESGPKLNYEEAAKHGNVWAIFQRAVATRNAVLAQTTVLPTLQTVDFGTHIPTEVLRIIGAYSALTPLEIKEWCYKAAAQHTPPTATVAAATAATATAHAR